VLHVSNTSVVGPFRLSNTCASVQANTACQMQVSFAPTSVGPQTGTLTVTDDGSTPTQSIALTGTGVPAPTLTISPASLSFTAQLAGTRSSAQTVTLSNSSTQTASIFNIAIAGSSAFSVSNNNCPGSLASAASCQVSVQFSPADGSPSEGTLSISDNAAGNPQQVALVGQGVALAINSTPTSQTVKSGSSATFQLNLSESAPYSESLALSCAGLPVYANCAFSPATVNLTSMTPATSSLTISTGSTVAYEKPKSSWPTAATIVAAIGIPLLFPRKRQFRFTTLQILLFGMLATLTLASCSSGTAPVNDTRTAAR
jgi:Abnormal spindle-like microcephaly-assoc'd, ASPM-SPD-2-Hydin